LSKTISIAAVSLFLVGLLCGLGAWGSYEGVTSLVTTNAFCTSCHEMQVVADGYHQSVYFMNPVGVRADCADCHVPKPFIARVVHMILANRDVVGHVLGVIDTPAKFEAQRLDMAKRVWAEMTDNGSVGCRGCHSFEAMDFSRQPVAASTAMHVAMPPGTSCITCHRGIAHRIAVAPVKLPALPPVVQAAPVQAAPVQAAPVQASTKGFVGVATTQLSATPAAAPFATLYVSTPLAIAASATGVAHVTSRLWLKGDAVSAGPLYAAPGGIQLGRLDSAPPATNAKAGAADNGWLPLDLNGYLAADAVVDSLEPVWQAAESTYEFTCAGCHVLHAAAAYSPAQWDTEMATMAKSANLRPDDAMFVLKWLQTTSLTSKADQ
jgi:trimethylamine-N-oxide reductase (cytochrome c), cytochrome c-type subunit TorC